MSQEQGSGIPGHLEHSCHGSRTCSPRALSPAGTCSCFSTSHSASRLHQDTRCSLLSGAVTIPHGSMLESARSVVINGRTYVYQENHPMPASSPESTSSSTSLSSPPLSSILSSPSVHMTRPMSPTLAPMVRGVARRSYITGGSKPTHLCSVCGDRAFYVFYGALACDSCRTFFRRQVLQSKKLVCHFKGSCHVQLNTRKDCAKCRLDKCVRVGMKSSLVAVNELPSPTSGKFSPPAESTDTATFARPCFVNPLLRNNPQNNNNWPMSGGIPVECRSTPASPIMWRQNSLIKSSLSQSSQDVTLESWSGTLTPSPPSQSNDTSPTFYRSKKHLALLKNVPTSLDVSSETTSSTNDESVFTRPSLVARKSQTKPEPLTIHLTNIESNTVREITVNAILGTERERLLELVAMAKQLESKACYNTSAEPMTFNLCNIIYLATRKLIASIEALKSFKFLPRDDQVILLRNSISEILFLWSVRSFDMDTKSWKLPCFKTKFTPYVDDLKLTMGVLKGANDDNTLYTEYENFVRGFDAAMAKDSVLVNILIAICLFNPDRDGLIEKDHIRCERKLYLGLLEKYLKSALESGSSTAFIILSQKIDQLSCLTEIYERTEVVLQEINQLVETTHHLKIQSATNS